jgi:hypothetical protein
MSNYQFFLYFRAYAVNNLLAAPLSCAKLQVVMRNFHVNLRFNTRKSLFKLLPDASNVPYNTSLTGTIF